MRNFDYMIHIIYYKMCDLNIIFLIFKKTININGIEKNFTDYTISLNKRNNYLVLET